DPECSVDLGANCPTQLQEPYDPTGFPTSAIVPVLQASRPTRTMTQIVVLENTTASKPVRLERPVLFLFQI
ncbi:hypothetical protein EI94DRAFT_1863583, partial [Lactarius quietus]